MKRTIFGVMIATFLMISVSFITPVNVKAAEANINQTKENIGNLASIISDHERFEDLIQNEDLLAIINDVIDNGASEQKAIDYYNIIKDLDAFKEICSDDVVSYAESIYRSFEKILKEKPSSFSNEESGFYLKLEEDNTFTISEEEIEGAVYINSDKDIVVPGYGTVEFEATQNILQLMVYLFLAGVAGTVGIAAIVVVFMLLEAIFAAIGAFFGGIAGSLLTVVIVWAVVSGASMFIGWILYVIQELLGSEDNKSKSKLVNKKLQRISSKIQNLIGKIFAFFNMKIQNVFS